MKILNKRRVLVLVAAFFLVFAAAACEDDSSEKGDARETEQASINDSFERVTNSQQVPTFDFSQERQTLIDVLTVRAEGTHGTAYITSLDGTLLWWCPTLGAPIPSTYQLTNPDQIIGGDGERTEEQVIPLGEPTGVYTGDSTATWVVCLDDNGTPFGRYEEANISWTSGVVDGLPADKRAVVNEVTFEFTTEETAAEG